ncbi:MAG: hypothetical protein CMA10_06320 [Euryarchaeota archaeon]|nr:hypothetical protein [Euryarchaeota archaeon]
MGVRDWLKSTLGPKQVTPAPKQTEQPQSNDDPQVFADVQQIRAEEALALFGEPDEQQEPPAEPITAPYDAGEADAFDLLSEDQSPSFTHTDEVMIEDVSEIEDPYLDARIEGDISETVVLGK